MPKAIQPLTLSDTEQTELRMIVNQGMRSARTIKRAQILLHSHAGKKPTDSADGLDIAPGTVYNTLQRYWSEGLPGALHEKPRPGQPIKLDLRQEAAIAVLAWQSERIDSVMLRARLPGCRRGLC